MSSFKISTHGCECMMKYRSISILVSCAENSGFYLHRAMAIWKVWRFQQKLRSCLCNIHQAFCLTNINNNLFITFSIGQIKNVTILDLCLFFNTAYSTLCTHRIHDSTTFTFQEISQETVRFLKILLFHINILPIYAYCNDWIACWM